MASYLENLPEEVFIMVLPYLSTKDLRALAASSKSMFAGAAPFLALRCPRSFIPKSVEEIDQWNKQILSPAIKHLVLPSLNININLSNMDLDPNITIPPINLPQGLRYLNLVHDSASSRSAEGLIRVIHHLLGSLSSDHAHSLQRLHLSLRWNSSFVLPTLHRLQSFALSLLPSRDMAVYSQPLPNLSIFPPRSLTSLSLSYLSDTPIEDVVKVLGHFPSLKHLTLHLYQAYGTVKILQTLITTKTRHLRSLSLHEAAIRYQSMSFNEVNNYVLALSRSFLELKTMGVQLQELSLTSMSFSGHMDYFSHIYEAWSDSLRILTFSEGHINHLFGSESLDVSWPVLEKLHIQDARILNYFVPQSPPSSPCFPALKELYLEGIQEINFNTPYDAHLSYSSRIQSPFQSASAMFPSLKSLAIGRVHWNIFPVIICPGAHVYLTSPMGSSYVTSFVHLIRHVGPSSLTLPRLCVEGDFQLLISYLKAQGKGRVGRVSYWEGEEEVIL